MRDGVSIKLPLEAEAAARARQALQRFRPNLDPISYVDLRLLVSELVVDALRPEPDSHPPFIELKARLQDDRVRVEISQGSAAYRLSSSTPEPGAPGWGLHLARVLARRWGLRREPPRATVWLEMGTDGG
jgi:hypothetical protein